MPEGSLHIFGRPPRRVAGLNREHQIRQGLSYLLLATGIIYYLAIISEQANCQLATIGSAGELREQVERARESKCLACIRQVSSIGLRGDLSKQKCDGYYCGPYQISYQYWAEAGKPRGSGAGAGSFEKCARDSECAELTVRAYFKKFRRDCNADGRIDCLDMAALHKAGPSSCASAWFYKSRFWQAFNKTSCATERLDVDYGDEMKTSKNQDKQSSSSSSLSGDNQRAALKNETLTSECLDCICEALTSCGPAASSQSCGTGSVCGPFAISQSYWVEGKRPGASWTACARTRECSMVAIKNYMEKQKRDCNGDGLVTCEDYAAIHRRGPRACSNRDMLREPYWQRLLACRANQRPAKDVNMVKVDSTSGGADLASRGDQAPGVAGQEASTNKAEPPLVALSPASYELRPAQHETEASPAETQTSAASTIHYQHSTRTRIKSPASSSTTMRPPENTSRRAQASAAKNQERPAALEQQLPTIIVSKPLGAASTQRFVQATPQFSPTASAAPPSSSTTSAPTITTTTTSTTLAPPSSTSLAAHTEPSEASAATSSQPDSDSLIDYSIPEPFPFPIVSNSRGSGDSSAEEQINHDAVDRTSFDKVVNGIVANPDFSKSYPPTPGGALESTSAPRRRAQQQQQQQQQQQLELGSHDQQALKSRLGFAQAHQRPQLDERPNSKRPAEPESAPPIVGPESVSMGSLFERGLNESSKIAAECLDCICDASSNCDTTVQCISKQREKNRCGLYMISWNQYKESDISLTTLLAGGQQGTGDDYDEKLYYECSTDKNCAEKLIHLYIEKHQRDCNDDGKIDCFDIAAIHRVGPELCSSAKFLASQYWKDFNICYATDRLATTTMLDSAATPNPSSPQTTTSPTYLTRHQSQISLLVS